MREGSIRDLLRKPSQLGAAQDLPGDDDDSVDNDGDDNDDQ